MHSLFGVLLCVYIYFFVLCVIFFLLLYIKNCAQKGFFHTSWMLLACRNKEERQQEKKEKKTRVVITAENKRVIKCSLLILCTNKNIYFMIKCICKYDKTPFFSKNKKNTKKNTHREREYWLKEEKDKLYIIRAKKNVFYI